MGSPSDWILNEDSRLKLGFWKEPVEARHMGLTEQTAPAFLVPPNPSVSLSWDNASEKEIQMWTPSWELELCHKPLPGIWATLSVSKWPINRTQNTKLKFSNLLFHLYFQASNTVGPLNEFSVMVVQEDTIIHTLFYFPSLSFINVVPFLNGNEEWERWMSAIPPCWHV